MGRQPLSSTGEIPKMLQRNSTGCFFHEIFCQRQTVLQVSSRELSSLDFSELLRVGTIIPIVLVMAGFSFQGLCAERARAWAGVCVAEAVTGAPQVEGEEPRRASRDGRAFRWESPCATAVPSHRCARRCGGRPSLHPQAPGGGEALPYSVPPAVLSFPTWTGSYSTREIVTILGSTKPSFLSSRPTP